MAPTFFTAIVGPVVLNFFSVAMVLVTFDMHNRDRSSRIQEVLDSLPPSNVEVNFARLFGLIIVLAIPMLLFLVVVIAYGFITERAGFGYGSLIELWSIASLLVWDFIPNLLFAGALTLFFTSLVRSILLVILLALLSICVMQWLILNLPMNLASLLATTTGSTIFPSELAPQFSSLALIFNRFALTLFACGLIVLASYFRSRPIANIRLYALSSMGFFGLSLAILCSLILNEHLRHREVSSWAQWHNKQDQSTFPDITHVSGSVDILPGSSVALDLTVRLLPPDVNQFDFVVLSLNPGYRDLEVQVDAVEVYDYRFKKGLLQLPNRLFGKEAEVAVQIRARGRPDARFAYLDAAVDTSEIAGVRARQLHALGTQNYIFHSKFVVLVEGINWLPTSGSANGKGDWDERSREYFAVDLSVSVPRDWIVVGGGHREIIAHDKRSVYRISPRNPIPHLSLVSSNFERASVNIEDVEFEVLFAKRRRQRFDEFRPIKESIEYRIQSYIQELRKQGLSYPYSVFSIVEVPTHLRVFGGGWRMDSIMSPPGIVMMRESSLPTAKISLKWERMYQSMIDNIAEAIPDYPRTQEGYLGIRFMGSNIAEYFSNNVHGEHPIVGFARNLIAYQSAATGEGTTVLNLMLEELTQQLLLDQSPFMSDHLLTRSGHFFSLEVAMEHAVERLVECVKRINSARSVSHTPVLENVKQFGKRLRDGRSVTSISPKRDCRRFKCCVPKVHLWQFIC